MRILHITPNYYPSMGGLQLITRNISERLVCHYRDEVKVFTTNALQSVHSRRVDRVPVGVEIINGVTVRRFSFSRWLTPLLRYFIILSRYFPLLPGQDYFQILKTGPISLSMWKEVRRTSSQIISASPFNYLHMYYPLSPRNERIPLIYMGALHLPPDGMVLPMVLKAIHLADAYIAFTRYERDMLVQQGILPSKLHVIGLGVELEKYQEANGQLIRQKYGIGTAPLVGFLGRQAAYKGVDTLLYAMQRVWNQTAEAYLLIAGLPTDFSVKIQTIIAELPEHQRKQVIYMGDYLEDGPNSFAACDVFVTVSSQESFGIVYLEAWASGTPVIGGRIGAVASVIDDGKDGLLVECGNVDELAGAILRLLSNEEMRRELAKNGYEKVRAEHTWNVVTKKIRAVYESVL